MNNEQSMRKLNYHQRSNSRSNHLMTSSPIKVKKDKYLTEKLDNSIDDDLRNTIQSINDKDHVNYMAQSHNLPIFKTAIKKPFEDQTSAYKKANDNIINAIQNSIDYFKSTNFENIENVKIIKLPKEEYEKLKNDNESLILENKKLNKNKQGNDINVNKFIESLMYLQNKNENLEQEVKILKKENEELKKKEPFRKRTDTKPKYINKTKNDQMETLLKEQIECMKKMLLIVQDNKTYSDSDSNLHFEESFNVTNMSSNGDFHEDTEIVNTEKDFKKNPRIEKKNERKKENAIDDNKGIRPNSSVNFNASNNSTYGKIKKKSGDYSHRSLFLVGK